MQSDKPLWNGHTDGGNWGQRVLIKLLNVVNISLLYSILALVVPFYMLFKRKSYLAIYHYFRYRLNYSAWDSFVKTYLNHFIFGQCMFDKFAVWSGKKDFFRVKITGFEDAEQISNGEKGCIIATSHIGNFELAGYLFQMNLGLEKNPFSLFQQKQQNFYIMLHGGESETIMQNRQQYFANNNITMIMKHSDMSHIFTLYDALGKGSAVSINCDRYYGNEKTISVDFFEAKAAFPQSPFAIAVHCQVPVLATFCLKENKNTYRIHYQLLDIGNVSEMNKNDQIRSYVSAYARAMENILRQYPTQWFNFYEFWN